MKIYRYPNTINYNICDSTTLVTVNQSYRIRKTDPKLNPCLFVGSALISVSRKDAATLLRSTRKRMLSHAG